jgi:hypothetical protein
VNGLFLFLALKLIKISKLSFDDWTSGTFQGIIFLMIFFSVQENLYLNAKKLF